MDRRFTITASRHGYFNEPVTVALEGLKDLVSEPVMLNEIGTGRPVAAQPIARADGSPGLCLIVDDLPCGETCECEITREIPAGCVELVQTSDNRIEFHVGHSVFTAYHFGADIARPFMYPVIGPGGRNVTRHYPMVKEVPGETTDHKHHRSIWVAYGDLNGSDDWSEDPGHATVRHRKFLEQTSGPVYGRIRALNDWLDGSGKKIMEEEREITVYNIPDTARVIDMRVLFKATEGDVRFGDTKEGGICSVRVATTMDGDKGGMITNSYGGVSEADTWGKRAHWCDYSGLVDGRMVGITIFDNPSNFRYPTYWHVRNYGLMTANPFALSAYTGDRSRDGSHVVPAGAVFPFAYRIYIHDGDAAAGRVAEKYHGYMNPPTTADRQ